jgi:hypothetical protein
MAEGWILSRLRTSNIYLHMTTQLSFQEQALKLHVEHGHIRKNDKQPLSATIDSQHLSKSSCLRREPETDADETVKNKVVILDRRVIEREICRDEPRQPGIDFGGKGFKILIIVEPNWSIHLESVNNQWTRQPGRDFLSTVVSLKSSEGRIENLTTILSSCLDHALDMSCPLRFHL